MSSPRPTLSRRVVSTFYRRLYFMARELELPIPDLHSHLADSRYRELASGDIAAYRELRPDQHPELAARRLAAGCRCLGTWSGSRLLDTAWFVTGRGPVPWFFCDIELNGGDVYVFDSFTHPDFRGHNLYATKVTELFRRSKKVGYLRNVALVAPENRAPVVILKRLKSRVIGEFRWLGAGPAHFSWQHGESAERLPRLTRGSRGRQT